MRRLLSPALWIVPLLVAGAFVPSLPRALQVLVFAALMAALWDVGRRIAGGLVPDFPGLSGAVAAFTVAFAVATTLALGLGICGGLQPRFYLLLLAVVYLACRAIRPPERVAPPPEKEAAPRDRQDKLEAVLLLAAAMALGVVTLATIRELRFAPPGLFGYDDLTYHLTAVAVWQKWGDLRMMKLAVGDPSSPFYPILSELGSWVALAPFGDSDVAARWSQLPFALFSALALAAVARRLGLCRRSAALAALLYLAIPHVLPELALSAGNDHTAGFLTLAALDAVLAMARDPRRGHAAYAGLALGLLAGTKYLTLFYCATLAGVLIVGLLARRRPIRSVAGLVAGVVGVALLAGGYAYLRNAWTTGNPVFPAPVHLFGRTIFPGWALTGLGDRLKLPEARIALGPFLLHNPDFFGAWAPFTLLPAALLAPFAALFLPWRGNRPEPGGFGERLERGLVLALPAIFFLEFLAFMHDHRDPRYVLPGIALAGAAFAWLLESAGPRLATVLRGLVALWVLHDLLSRSRPALGMETLEALLLAGAAALALDSSPRLRTWTSRPALKRWAAIALPALLLLAALPLGRVTEAYQKRKLAAQPAARALEQRLAPTGARLAYVGWNQPYLFFGSRLQNQVEILPHAWSADLRFYGWGRDPTLPFDHWRPNAWLQLLDELAIDFVVVRIHHDAQPDPERRWITDHPERFDKVYEDAETAIWRVVRPRLG